MITALLESPLKRNNRMSASVAEITYLKDTSSVKSPAKFIKSKNEAIINSVSK